MRSALCKTKGLKSSWIVLLALFIASAQGCSICCQPHLDDYVAFGSRTPRSDMKFGRVGSPFSDPNHGAPVSASMQYYDEGAEVYYDQGYEGAVVDESREIYFEGE